MKEEFCKFPASETEWIKIADDSYRRWNFPNGIAAIDGKHIAITNPNDGASEFYNYKGFHSIVLMEIFSHDYRFIAHDVGCQGRISDGGVWANTTLCREIKQGTVHLPQPRKLPQVDDDTWEQDENMEDDNETR